MIKPIGKKILVIPDAHARPDANNKRFDTLGNFIAEKRPDIIVNIGDLADMGSLCSYDKGKKEAEGRRYQDDIDAANDALHRYTAPAFRVKGYTPKWYVTLGNHENRINRAASEAPELFGKLSTDDIMFRYYDHKVVPFLVPLVLQGIMFMHYLPSGAMGKPTGGVNHARSLMSKGMCSIVVGHSHERGYAEATKANGEKMFGLVAGVYDDPGDKHAYAHGTQHNWWSGLTILNEAHNGTAEPSFYSYNYVQRNFS